MQNNNRDCTSKIMDTSFDMSTFETNINNPIGGESLPGIVCPPVYECPQERVCHRYICHEVPHVCPCNTRIVNHHIYRHTYTPCYTCCEENEFSNVYDGNCCM